ncbi:MAG TPA: 6-phosphofructokinase [Candidatus Aphodoplasma excrementigallinarum]|uniref:ATP-dependent 6-phosphofructokinase n=1 Tax=Candidatus Aphodoplasma excrementigallinarum TaxID=2840673 RepID=A0A9D1NG84_9FIRM|nr:6-phosphofructokinase [Candidatus Aphodoplasma excrementigallinarum]
MAEIKTIGVLTSGGDAPGMNAALRAVVRTAVYNGLKVMGVKKGYNGLINGDIFEMTARSVSETLQRGGTILQTARCAEFRTEEGVKRGAEIAKIFGIDGLVVIGGDGSFRGARDLAKHGISTIGIPGTIDNDIGCTEYCIGFDTALNTAMEAIDKIRDTATSHERSSVIEVMGRNAGYIALNVGISCGAEAVIIPEKEFNFDEDVLRPIIEGKHRGKNHYLVILAEGVGSAIPMAEEIEKRTGIETTATVLGHIQRGGSPTVQDRVNASAMGFKAVELLLAGKTNRLVVMQNGKVTDVDIDEGLQEKKEMDPEMVKLCKVLSW